MRLILDEWKWSERYGVCQEAGKEKQRLKE